MQKIKCPNCQIDIDVDEVLSVQVEEQLSAKYEKRVQEFETKRTKALADFQKELSAFQKEKEDQDKIITQKLAVSLKQEKEKLTNQLKKDLEKENQEKETYWQKKLADEQEKTKRFRQEQIKLLEEKDKLKEEQENFELQKKKELSDAKEEITASLSEKFTKEHQFKFAEQEKKILDMQKALADAERKLTQKSQQLQGEIQELALEETLTHEFPSDEISPVGKGVNGADLIQMVRGKRGENCGVIVWESKRTKAWTDNWVQKLKDDMRLQKADLAILVSEVLPKGIKNFSQYHGIWVSDFASSVGLAQALRMQLINLQSARASMEHHDEKMANLYHYLTSSEFAHKIEAIVEVYTDMQNDLDKEKKYYKTKWAKQSTQIDKVIENTLGMYGGLQGMIGNKLPKIQQLELVADTNEENLFD